MLGRPARTARRRRPDAPRQGVVAASCRPGSTSTPSPAVSSRCSTACCSSASRPGTRYRPADLERRAGGDPRPPRSARRSAATGRRRRSPSRRRSIAGHGPRPDRPRPDRPRRRSGSPCRTSTPQIALWHIQDRWDYWQLTRDEPVILGRAGAFRDAGGSGLVDLTLPGVGRDPAWLRGAGRGERPARRHGRRLVPDGLLPARGADRPAVGRRPGRRARRARSTDGVGETGIRPGHHRRDRDRQAVGLAGRGAGPPGGGAGGAPDRPRHHDPRGPVRRRARPAARSSRRRAWIRRRVVIGHADSYPVLDHYLAIIGRGANLEFDFLGMPWERERHRRDADDRAGLRAARTRVTPIACSSARTSATTRS